MCNLCGDATHRDVTLTIRDISKNTQSKINEAIETLCKAGGITVEKSDNKGREEKEQSPYRSVRDLETRALTEVSERLDLFATLLVGKWLHIAKAKIEPPFKIDGHLYINPRTGKFMTKSQWKEITDTLERGFRWVFGNSQDKITALAVALGMIVRTMADKESAHSLGLDALGTEEQIMEQADADTIAAITSFAQAHAAEHIVDLTSQARKNIALKILEAYQNRWNPEELERELYEEFGDLNRDWRRIAETEINDHFNNGYLVTELSMAPDGEYHFMIGVSSPNACDWCLDNVRGNIVVLLPGPPAGSTDEITINGELVTAIWPGKSNAGLSRAQWWVAAGTQHPHCVLGDQSVTAGMITSVMKGFYEGYVVEVLTNGGRRFAVTENHPVLTPWGFRLAKFLDEGDYIITSTDAEGIALAINPNNDQRPTSIENLYTTAIHAFGGTPTAVKTTSKDLYGDGRFLNGKISVVNTNSLLEDCDDTVVLQVVGQTLFNDTGLNGPLIIEGSRFQNSSRLFGTTNSSMGSRSHVLPILIRGKGHSSVHGSRSSSWSQVGFEQALTKGSACHSEFSRQLLLRFSRLVQTEDVLRKGRVSSDSSALLIPDKITSVGRRWYSGHVYDLTDDSYGVYTCNSVVVKNCRCTWTQYMEGMDEIEGAILDEAERLGP
jgi:hypothetical protein